MKLELFNDVGNANSWIKEFMSELANYLAGKNSKQIESEVTEKMGKNSDNLKQENTFYQVVEVNTDGAYLFNASTGKTTKETDISQDLLDTIGEDYILKYANDEYIVDEKETEQFQNSLVDVREYSKIKEEFVNESNISELPKDTIYTVQYKGENETLLNYDGGTLEVPNALIPYFSETGAKLYYENGKFKIEY